MPWEEQDLKSMTQKEIALNQNLGTRQRHDHACHVHVVSSPAVYNARTLRESTAGDETNVHVYKHVTVLRTTYRL